MMRTLAAALGGLAAGQTFVGPEYIPSHGHASPLWLDPPKEAAVASCAIDVGISLVFLGHAGTAINAAVKTCDETEQEKGKAICAASVSGIVDGLAYAVGFLSQAAAECQRSFQVQNAEAIASASCAADVSNFVASLALLAQAGSSMHVACTGKDKRVEADQDFRLLNRRLAEEQPMSVEVSAPLFKEIEAARNVSAADGLRALQHLPEGHASGWKNDYQNSNYQAPTDELLQDRSAEIASCVFDVGQATLFVARAALMINSAVADCSRFELRTGGERSHAKCAVDVSSVISAFGFVSSGISFAAYHCAYYSTLGPACAGAVSNVVAALAQVAASGASFEATCGYKKPPVEQHV